MKLRNRNISFNEELTISNKGTKSSLAKTIRRPNKSNRHYSVGNKNQPKHITLDNLYEKTSSSNDDASYDEETNENEASKQQVTRIYHQIIQTISFQG